MEREDIKKVVKDAYGGIARRGESGSDPVGSCCGGAEVAEKISRGVGYSEEELHGVAKGANLGLGCGNPVALASLQEGEVVLDLGSGGGLDVFLAAGRVGSSGRVIGIDITPAMIERAREHAKKGHVENVEFRLGEIEALPVEDETIDVVISNCVINLSPDKPQVFRETLRVLRPGGKLMISDLVLLKELPDPIKRSVKAYYGCLAGAMMKDAYTEAIRAAGFQDVQVLQETSFPLEFLANDPTTQAIMKESNLPPEQLDGVVKSIVSVKISGIKPSQAA